MEFLVQYVDKHFSTEEELMEFYGYPKRDGHEEQHVRLCREVEELYDRMKQAKSLICFTGELHFLMSDWYVYHIKHWDKGCATFLQERVVRGLTR